MHAECSKQMNPSIKAEAERVIRRTANSLARTHAATPTLEDNKCKETIVESLHWKEGNLFITRMVVVVLHCTVNTHT